MDGGYGYQNLGDRAGILCRTVADAVAVLDAVKGYETSDPYTDLPAGLIPDEPYETFLVGADKADEEPLAGMRVAVVREFMVKHTANDAAISDQIDAEIKRVIRDRLGAELVETTDPAYPDDPDVPNLSYTFLEMQKVLRLIVQKVMTENGIDAFVNPETTLPPYKIGGPDEPVVDWRDTNSCCQRLTALMGAPEMEVPAGYTQVVYEPSYALTEDRKRYSTVTGTVETRLPVPMPISLMLWAAPGGEPALIKVASAYEAATQHRVPPPDFGPVD